MVALVPSDVLARPPSREDGISEGEEDQLRRFGGSLIQRAGGLLKLPQFTVVSAAAMFQRFYYCKSFAEYDVRSLAAAALVLASKLEEHPRKLVEVIQVCYRVKMRGLKEEDGTSVYEGKPTPQLDPSKREFHDEKKEVVLGERRILRELGFEVALLLDHPHRYAIEFIEHLNRPEDLAQKVWNFLNDSIQTSLCCSHQPQDIAGACLLLAAREMNVTLPSKPPWWKQFSVDMKDAEQIAEELVRLYEKEPPEFIDVCRPKKEVAPPATPWTSPPPMLLKSPSDELLEEPQQDVEDDPERQVGQESIPEPGIAEVLAEGEAILAEIQPKAGFDKPEDRPQGFDKPEADKKAKSNGKKERAKERDREAGAKEMVQMLRWNRAKEVCQTLQAGNSQQFLKLCGEASAKRSWFARRQTLKKRKLLKFAAAVPYIANSFDSASETLWRQLALFGKHSSPAGCYEVTINQKSRFGIGDVYFVANAMGICEVVEDEIKRVSAQHVHLQSGRKLEAQVILKLYGFNGNFDVDRLMNVKHMMGFWPDEDFRRYLIAEPIGVNATNFGGTSFSPGVRVWVDFGAYFLWYPKDFANVRDSGLMPSHAAEPEYDRPAYVIDARHGTQTIMGVNGATPAIAESHAGLGLVKRQKQLECHPTRKYLEECRLEWEEYGQKLKDIPTLPPRVFDYPGKTGASRSNWEDWMVNLRGEDAWLAGPRDLSWYTGQPPMPGLCPGVSPDGAIRALPMPDLNKLTRKQALEYFDNSWTMLEVLFAGFHGEEPFYRPPVHGLRHPQIFYYGHTPCFYVNKLRVAGVLKDAVDPYMESIMEVGVDEMLWDDMHKNDMVWPTVKEVQEYRKKVYNIVREVIATHPDLEDNNGTTPVKITWDHPLWSIFMGVEHEAIHVETSSVLFRETPSHLMQVPASWPGLHPSSLQSARSLRPEVGQDFPQNEMLSVTGETVKLGKPRDFPSYGWDNEYGHRSVQVPDFKASKYMITNGEFWHFVTSGGYRSEKYWQDRSPWMPVADEDDEALLKENEDDALAKMSR
ncbi:CYCL1-1 [Symbiodinium microadriaticum]|nr:CYCL1-1 [Symbiodinium microadriaticum]